MHSTDNFVRSFLVYQGIHETRKFIRTVILDHYAFGGILISSSSLFFLLAVVHVATLLPLLMESERGCLVFLLTSVCSRTVSFSSDASESSPPSCISASGSGWT